MEILWATFFFGLGAIVGSFLNVVILRYNTGVSLYGRSRCFSCGKRIAWYDLIPVLSFFILGGRCRSCKSSFSFEYPLVEAVTGLLFVGVFLKFYPSLTMGASLADYLLSVVALLAMCILVVITVYDIRHQIIPDLFVFLFCVLGLISVFLSLPIQTLFVPPYLNLLSGPILASPFALLWLVSGGRWIGFGDAKLALGIGWFLGLVLGLSAVMIAFTVGAIVGLVLIGLSKFGRSPILAKFFLSLGPKDITMKSALPFAPFLILGFLVVFFFGWDVTGLSAII